MDGVSAFILRFMRPARDVSREREVLLEVDGRRRSATAYLPRGDRSPGPAWVLLQGVTVPGRHHEGLRRMGRALAAAGHVALVPEVPSWTDLHVDPREAEPTVRGALAWLDARPDVEGSRVGLLGFSVAATWALAVAAGDLRGRVRAVAGLGGYGDFGRTVRAMVTGEHEWKGRRYHHTPDPYGRWIVGADLLPRLEGAEFGARADREAAARALHLLAQTAGRNGALARTPVYDSLIADLRAGLPSGALRAWDLLAPPSGRPVPDAEAGRALAAALAEAGLRAYPGLDPAGRLDGLSAPVVLMHGRLDTLIPFTETLRLASELPPGVERRVTVTRLVGHAKTAEAGPPRNPAALAAEVWRFVGTVRDLLRSVER